MNYISDGTVIDQRTYDGLCDIFNRVASHLLKQARRAVAHSATGGMGCRYRLCDGRACAVGCLITDQNYHDGLERKNSDDPLVVSAVTASLGRSLTKHEQQLLEALQHVHDIDLATWGDDSGIPAWSIVASLNRVAHRFDLPGLPKPKDAPAGV